MTSFKKIFLVFLAYAVLLTGSAYAANSKTALWEKDFTRSGKDRAYAYLVTLDTASDFTVHTTPSSGCSVVEFIEVLEPLDSTLLIKSGSTLLRTLKLKANMGFSGNNYVSTAQGGDLVLNATEYMEVYIVVREQTKYCAVVEE